MSEGTVTHKEMVREIFNRLEEQKKGKGNPLPKDVITYPLSDFIEPESANSETIKEEGL